MIRLKIKEVALLKGIGQNQLARLADIDNKTASRIFQNPYQIVNTETLDRIARALNVDASLLLESEPALPKTIEEDTEQGENTR